MVYSCPVSGEAKVKVAGLFSHKAWPLMASLTKGQLSLFTPRQCMSTCQATGWFIIPGSEPLPCSVLTPQGRPQPLIKNQAMPLVSLSLCICLLCCDDILLFKCDLWMLLQENLGVCLLTDVLMDGRPTCAELRPPSAGKGTFRNDCP